jgi:hypothetical protein
MARASKQGLVKVLELDTLLDKLVAVRLDLEPICGTSEVRGQIVDSRAAIAEACEILRTAIADLMNVIVDLEGRADGLEVLPSTSGGERDDQTRAGADKKPAPL